MHTGFDSAHKEDEGWVEGGKKQLGGRGRRPPDPSPLGVGSEGL